MISRMLPLTLALREGSRPRSQYVHIERPSRRPNDAPSLPLTGADARPALARALLGETLLTLADLGLGWSEVPADSLAPSPLGATDDQAMFIAELRARFVHA